MHPQPQWCHNPQGPASGQRGPGNMPGHRRVAQRDRGTTGGRTCAATNDPAFSRLRTAADVVTRVLTWRSPGCPTPAIVAAVGRDARTVAAGVARAGDPGQPRPQQRVRQGQVNRPHVQADERWGTRVGRRGWLALALAVPARRWLGGVISPPRALVLLPTLVPRVRSWARTLALGGGVAGWASDVTACRRGFRPPVRTGRPGRPRVVPEQGVLWGHVVQRDAQRRGVRVERRGVRGTATAIAAVVAATHRGSGSKTADRERLTATCRAALAPRVRRGRASAHPEAGLTAGMWRVGCADTWCGRQDRLRVAAPVGACWPWQERTPAMAAGLTNHRWTRPALLCDPVPQPPWVALKRRGRPPTQVLHPGRAVAA
jgi:hypothetical protein